jgi:hypothetical protein
MSGHDASSTACCTRLVEARGLGPIFAAFMQKASHSLHTCTLLTMMLG